MINNQTWINNEENTRLFFEQSSWGNELKANLGNSTARARGSDFLHNVFTAMNTNPVRFPDDQRDILMEYVPQETQWQMSIPFGNAVGDAVAGNFFANWIGADFETIMRTLAIVVLAILLIGLGIGGLLMTTETGRGIVKKGVEAAAA